MRCCQACGRPLPLLARPDRTHCDATCRQRHRRLRLRALPPSPAPDLDQLSAALEPHLTEVALVTGVAAAARTDWRAAAFLLEQRHPSRWAGGTPGLDAELEEELWR